MEEKNLNDVEVAEQKSVPAAPAAKNTHAAQTPDVITIDRSVMLGDENDLLEVELPVDRRREDLDKMSRAIKSGSIMFGRVTANRVSDGLVRVMLKWESLTVTIPAVDFFAYSDMRGIDDTSDNDEVVKRYRQKASRMLGAAVSFVPKEIGIDEYGVPFVLGSRKEAMEKARERYFFGKTPIAAVGKPCKASIISAGPRYIYVECLGVEASIGTGELSAYKYITDAAKEFPVGEGITVAISALEIDKKNRKVDVKFSHSLLERGTMPLERVNPSMLHTRYAARVTGENKEFYFLILSDYKIRAIVPKQYVAGTNVMFEKGDKVSFLCTGIREDSNSLIGKAIKSN